MSIKKINAQTNVHNQSANKGDNCWLNRKVVVGAAIFLDLPPTTRRQKRAWTERTPAPTCTNKEVTDETIFNPQLNMSGTTIF